MFRLLDALCTLVCKLGGKWIFKLNFAYTISWWQFGCNDGWRPEFTTKFGWDVKMRSMQGKEFSKTCTGLFMT